MKNKMLTDMLNQKTEMVREVVLNFRNEWERILSNMPKVDKKKKMTM